MRSLYILFAAFVLGACTGPNDLADMGGPQESVDLAGRSVAADLAGPPENCMCGARQCGSNGCGGSCGSCPTGETCSPSGQCQTVCVPQCSGRECGDDGCGGKCGNNEGSCPAGTTCNTAGKCMCQPRCNGGQCGDDGCGHSCGTCQDGYACSGNTCIYTGRSTLTFQVENSCFKGSQIDYRFFDELRGIVWPDATHIYFTPAGATQNAALSCATGDSICFGGRLPDDSLYWGVDIDDSRSCSNCCYTCATRTQPINFTCN